MDMLRFTLGTLRSLEAGPQGFAGSFRTRFSRTSRIQLAVLGKQQAQEYEASIAWRWRIHYLTGRLVRRFGV